MEEQFCPKIQTCPLFNGVLLKRSGSEESYKNLYCKAGKQKWSSCKRYLTAQNVGKCADWILPNCSLSVDEIIVKMKDKGELVA
jgi:hypothetical protein